MATLRLLMTLRRVTYFTQNFDQCCVTHKLNVHQCRKLSTWKSTVSEDDGTAAKPKQRPKTVRVPKITLLLPNNSMMVTELANATRLAKHKNLNLIKISDPDTKTERATYKLVNNLIEETEIVQDDSNIQDKKSKSPKMLYISSKITKHDLVIKTTKVLKMLDKDNVVKICITLDGTEENNILDTITNEVKTIADIKKLSSKKNTILLLLSPLDKKNVNNLTENKKNKEATGASDTNIQSENS